MIHLRAALLALLVTAPAGACPAPGPELLFHSCWGAARADLALLPEDGLPAPSGRLQLVVTGGYTGRDERAPGRPNPVGLFIRGGELVNQTLARMDGILTLDPEGQPTIHARTDVVLAGRRHDLSDLAARRTFVAAAAERRLSVLQSHLLVVHGRIDVRPQDEAPSFRRRLLFADAHGWGLWQSAGALTLLEAAERISDALRPRMALNLDMGSYDLCLAREAGAERNCGFLAAADTAKLSNLLSLTLE